MRHPQFCYCCCSTFPCRSHSSSRQALSSGSRRCHCYYRSWSRTSAAAAVDIYRRVALYIDRPVRHSAIGYRAHSTVPRWSPNVRTAPMYCRRRGHVSFALVAFLLPFDVVACHFVYLQLLCVCYAAAAAAVLLFLPAAVLQQLRCYLLYMGIVDITIYRYRYLSVKTVQISWSANTDIDGCK